MRLLRSQDAAEFDLWAATVLGFPAELLMERAAMAVAERVVYNLPPNGSVHAFCGGGNNGADALAALRYLRSFVHAGSDIRAWLLMPRDRLGALSAKQAGWAEAVGIAVEEWRPHERVFPSVVIDGLFGVGLSRPLEGAAAQCALAINETKSFVVGVDVPSGIEADSSRVPEVAVRCNETVTFVGPKWAHVLRPANEFAGDVWVADLGLPIDSARLSRPAIELVGPDWVSNHLRPRPIGAHKGTFGHVLLICGSVGLSGAAVLATRGALRSGVGLVTVATPSRICSEVAAGNPEAMTQALQDSEGYLRVAALDDLLQSAERFDAIAIGPGLGRNEETRNAVLELNERWQGPLLLDADAIFAFDSPEKLRAAGPRVITPHPGEIARLMNTSVARVQVDRFAAASSVARASGATVVLKGEHTLSVDPSTGCSLVNMTGGPGLAHGGTGDVLTGLVGGLLAQGYEPLVAAGLGAAVHGFAGDLATAWGSAMAITAGDVASAIPQAFVQYPGARRGSCSPFLRRLPRLGSALAEALDRRGGTT